MKLKPSRRIFVAIAIVLGAVGAGLILASLNEDDGTEVITLDGGVNVPSGHGDVQVISDWIDTLSEGKPEQAADYFAVPSIAQNGTDPITLTSRDQVIAFNRSLPCGAELVNARSEGRFIQATFRLTERPGGSCGPGVGGLAQTAFVIENGKIAEWRRLDQVEQGDQVPDGPIV